MTSNQSWWLQDVAAQAAMDVAKTLALRDDGVEEADLNRAFAGLDKGYVRRALGLLSALGLAGAIGTRWRYDGDSRLRGANRDQSSVFFGQALQRYPPFVSYATLLSQGYSQDQSASIVRGVYRLGAQVATVRKALTSWGRYAELLDAAGSPVVEPINKLKLSVLHKLLVATQSQLQSMFVAAELGHELLETLATLGTGPDDIAEGILSHERRPAEAITGPAKALEQYLSSQQQPGSGTPLINLSQLADSLSSQKKILRSHKNLVYGVAAYRNASDHGPDPDSGRPWNVSPDAALLGTLVALQTIRSIHAFVTRSEQSL